MHPMIHAVVLHKINILSHSHQYRNWGTEKMAMEQMAMEIMAMEKMAKEIMAICKIWKKWHTYFIL